LLRQQSKVWKLQWSHHASQSLKGSAPLSTVDKSVNTTAVMIASGPLIRNIILGFFVRAFGLMTLAHVGRFLTRPVQSGKRYDAQVIWRNQQPPLSRQVR